jgi:molybdate transport system substrate-binding protein
MAGCTAREPAPEPLRIFAASSLTEVVETLVQQYDSTVATSFGSSSALARQIRDGAPADVFLSASPQWMDFLREAQVLADGPIVLARNRLVAIAPPGGELAGAGVIDPRSLLDRLASDDRIAIADEGVPAGEYARAALANLGLLDAYRSRLVGQSDVRAVLHAVERGGLPAGFVYSTDAQIATVEVLFVFDPADHPPIEYQAATLQGAADAEAARAFLAYLESEAARSWLAAAGFALPDRTPW